VAQEAVLMALRVVGYEGEGRNRRRIVIDEGPASASVARSIGEGKTALIAGLPDRFLTGGDGEVERRQITEAERDARRRTEQLPSPIARVVARPVVIPPRPPEEPVMAEQPQIAAPSVTPREKLEALDVAVGEAMEAAAALEAARIRWEAADRALRSAWAKLDAPASVAIEDASRAPVRLQATPEMTAASRRRGAVASKAVREARDAGATPRQAMEAGRKAKAATGGSNGTMPPYQRRMVDALLSRGGDRKAAAAALGITHESLTGTLPRIRARTDLTAAERDVVATTRKAPAKPAAESDPEPARIAFHEQICRCQQKGACVPHGWPGDNRRENGGVCAPHDHVDVAVRSADADAIARLEQVQA
jgi:hypothetical protein